MSRLLDRILTSCQRFKPSLFYSESELLDQLRPKLIGKKGDEAVLLARAREHWLNTEPVATKDAPLTVLKNIPVIAADDVALYVFGLGTGTVMADVVASMAPPLDQFFIEFQRVPNHYGLHAWGAHFTAVSDVAEIEKVHHGPPDNGLPRWVLKIDTYLEMQKGKPFGPVAGHVCGLAEDGTWFKHDDGALFWGGGPVPMSDELAPQVIQSWGDLCAQLLFPALMAITFMHCKNVRLDAVQPPEKLSQRHLKRYGRPLFNYRELTIDPMKKLLEQQRKGVGGNFRKALHLCRGHFKTFTEDAPLMGHATGTYFWAPHIRGAPNEGVVLKDYRVQAPSKLGRAYSGQASLAVPIAMQTSARST
jgi:hypothetical protein